MYSLPPLHSSSRLRPPRERGLSYYAASSSPTWRLQLFPLRAEEKTHSSSSGKCVIVGLEDGKIHLPTPQKNPKDTLQKNMSPPLPPRSLSTLPLSHPQPFAICHLAKKKNWDVFPSKLLPTSSEEATAMTQVGENNSYLFSHSHRRHHQRKATTKGRRRPSQIGEECCDADAELERAKNPILRPPQEVHHGQAKPMEAFSRRLALVLL